MSWLKLNNLGVELNTTTAAIFVGIFSMIYFIYKRYRQINKYQNIEDNELLMMKLKAARLKQQEIYSNMIKEQAEKKESNEKSSENDNFNKCKTSKKNESSLREYFPLMNKGSTAHYRPTRKRPCGPCNGGGCG